MNSSDDDTEAAAYASAHRAGMPASAGARSVDADGSAISTRTRVVNIRHEVCDVYVGRAGHGEDGYFGNPVRRGVRCQECGRTHVDNAATIRCYVVYFQRRILGDLEFRRRVLELRGLRLGCFCLPAPCHAQVIARWLNDRDEAAQANSSDSRT